MECVNDYAIETKCQIAIENSINISALRGFDAVDYISIFHVNTTR